MIQGKEGFHFVWEHEGLEFGLTTGDSGDETPYLPSGLILVMFSFESRNDYEGLNKGELLFINSIEKGNFHPSLPSGFYVHFARNEFFGERDLVSPLDILCSPYSFTF